MSEIDDLKAKINELTEANKTATAQLNDAQAKITELTKVSTEIAEDRKKLRAELKSKEDEKVKGTDNVDALRNLLSEKDKALENLTGEFSTFRQDSAIQQALLAKGLKDGKLTAAMKLIDRSKIATDGNGQIVGVDVALSSLETDLPDLFKKAAVPLDDDTKPKPTLVNGVKINASMEEKEKMTDAELVQMHTARQKHEAENAGRTLPGMGLS